MLSIAKSIQLTCPSYDASEPPEVVLRLAYSENKWRYYGVISKGLLSGDKKKVKNEKKGKEKKKIKNVFTLVVNYARKL